MFPQMRALLWKEWRQMRALFVALAVGGPVFMGAAWAYPGDRFELGESVGPAALIFLLFAAAVLPATAIAGERRTRTLGFLLEAPVARWKIVLAKALVGAVLWLALVALAACLGRLCSRTTWVLRSPMELLRPILDGGYPSFDHSCSWWEFAVTSLRVLLVYSCCFFLSAGLGRPLLAMMLGLALAAALVAVPWFLYPFHLVEWPHIPTSGWREMSRPDRAEAEWLSLGLKTLLCLWPLGLAWYVLARVRDHERRAGPIAKALGMTALLVGLPHLLALAFVEARYATQRPEDARRWTYVAACAPDGRWVAFGAQFATLPFAADTERAFFLDLETGRAPMVTRYRASFPISCVWTWAWSPDGRYLPYLVESNWRAEALDFRWRDLGGRSFTYRWAGLFDAEKGTARELTDPRLRGAVLCGWETERTLILRRGPIVPWPYTYYRYDVAGGGIEPLALPAVPGGGGPGQPWDHSWYHMNRHGRAYFQRSAGDDLIEIALYDPASGRWLAHALPRFWGYTEMSRDGRRLLTETLPYRDAKAPHQVLVYDVPEGRTRVLFEAEGTRWNSIWWRCSPQGRWVVAWPSGPWARQDGGPLLIDVATGQRRSIPRPGLNAEWVLLFAADETKLVWSASEPYYRSQAAEPRFCVYDISSGQTRPLPIPRGSLKRDARPPVTLARGGILFGCGESRLYRIGLDGTGLERVFPGRKALTLQEFEAETSARWPAAGLPLAPGG